jgi:Skp family chaperone for outer membrane proteins
MSLFRSLAAATCVAALAVAPSAFAQRNTAASALVINYQRLANESALGRDMTTKLQGLRTQIQQEAQALQPEVQSLEQERQRLTTATRGMTQAQVQANTTLTPQFQAFQQRVQTLQQRQQTLQGDMECSQLIAVRDFQAQIAPSIRTLMQSRGAGMVIDTGSVQLFDPQYDVTNTVIQQLDQNQSTRTATVARHGVAECQAQPAAAAH